MKFANGNGVVESKVKWPIPKEHGAWAMLYAPFFAGWAVAGTLNIPVFFLLVTISTIFLAHEPFLIFVRQNQNQTPNAERTRNAKFWLGIYFIVLVVFGSPLLFYYKLYFLIPLGMISGSLLSIHTYLAARRKERTIFGELLGVISLTSTAPAAYSVLIGKWDTMAYVLWTLNILYFASSIFYLKMRVSLHVKTRNHTAEVRQCVIYHAFLLLFLMTLLYSGVIPLLVVVAFFPIFMRTIYGGLTPEARLSLRKIGFTEVAYTIIFLLIVSLGFHTR